MRSPVGQSPKPMESALTPASVKKFNSIVGQSADITENCLMCEKPTHLLSEVKSGMFYVSDKGETHSVFFLYNPQATPFGCLSLPSTSIAHSTVNQSSPFHYIQ